MLLFHVIVRRFPLLIKFQDRRRKEIFLFKMSRTSEAGNEKGEVNRDGFDSTAEGWSFNSRIKKLHPIIQTAKWEEMSQNGKGGKRMHESKTRKKEEKRKWRIGFRSLNTWAFSPILRFSFHFLLHGTTDRNHLYIIHFFPYISTSSLLFLLHINYYCDISQRWKSVQK